MARKKNDDLSNPAYPKLAGVDKWRKLARERILSHQERLAYGDAVEKAIRAIQRQELMACCAQRRDSKPNCASGTYHNNGDDIHAAILSQQHRALMAAPSQIRRARSDSEWWSLYEEAMQEKRSKEMQWKKAA